MKPTLSPPDSPEAQAWREQCSQKIHDIEPRLSKADCDDLSSSLWQLDFYQCMPPRDAAEKFVAENLEMLTSVLTP